MEEVVMVGAGIVGVAMAVALRKVGIRSLVLERLKELRVTGVALGLNPNAWLALDMLGVSDKLAPRYDPIDKIGALPRGVHRKVLLEVLAEELPPNSIRFTSKITSIETQVEQGSFICIVTLDDGSIIKSKVSTVLELSMFPEGHKLDHGHRFQQFVDVGKRAGFVTLNDKEVYWFFVGKSPRKGMEKGVNPEMIQREESENLTKEFPPVYLNVVKHSDLSSLTWSPLMFGYPWDVLFGNLARSNVTMAGDAMHPMTPDLCQGGCSALEDMVVLGWHLGDLICKHGKLVTRDIGLAIDRYAKERRLRAMTLITASYFSGYV